MFLFIIEVKKWKKKESRIGQNGEDIMVLVGLSRTFNLTIDKQKKKTN
jgi:hypothetical protein